MSESVGAWLLLGVAICAANLPFVFSRVFLIFRTRDRGDKAFGWRLLEVLVLYLVVGLAAMLLESRSHGSVYAQGWEFYATTGCLFVVFAFPGFIYRYLWRHAPASKGGT